MYFFIRDPHFSNPNFFIKDILAETMVLNEKNGKTLEEKVNGLRYLLEQEGLPRISRSDINDIYIYSLLEHKDNDYKQHMCLRISHFNSSIQAFVAYAMIESGLSEGECLEGEYADELKFREGIASKINVSSGIYKLYIEDSDLKNYALINHFKDRLKSENSAPDASIIYNGTNDAFKKNWKNIYRRYPWYSSPVSFS